MNEEKYGCEKCEHWDTEKQECNNEYKTPCTNHELTNNPQTKV